MIGVLLFLTFIGFATSFKDPAPFIFIIIVDVLYAFYKKYPYKFYWWYPEKQQKMSEDYLHWFNYEQPHHYVDKDGNGGYQINGYEGTWINRELERYSQFLIEQQKRKQITAERARWKYKTFESGLKKNYQRYVVEGRELSSGEYHGKLTKGLF